MKNEGHFELGLDDHGGDLNGETRRKRSDTLVRTLCEQCGESFAGRSRGDVELGTLSGRAGATSLSDYLRSPANRQGKGE